MSATRERHPLALKPVVYHQAGMNDVPVTRDVVYHRDETASLRLDVYHPPDLMSPPVVLFVTGYPDIGVTSPLGCLFKEVQMFVSMAQLVATTGMAAVTYTTREPGSDLQRVLDFLDGHAASLNLDARRLGLWAVSGHGPVELAALMHQPARFQAAVLSNAYTFDIEGTAVADAFGQMGLVDACHGRSIDDMPPDVPLLVVRSGRDETPGLNESLDRFVAAAVEHNLPLTLVNHPRAPHCFELNDDSDQSRHIIRQMLSFVGQHVT